LGKTAAIIKKCKFSQINLLEEFRLSLKTRHNYLKSERRKH
jgi:hypothetical protein